MPWISRDVNERFWEKVEIKNNDECWPWKASKYGLGYGQFWILKPARKMIPAHRYVYQEIHNLELKTNDIICHRCDNPSCVNPVHLFKGTHKDNVADCIRKNRRVYSKGENNGNCKLNESLIKDIRVEYATGNYTLQDLATKYKIGNMQVSRIVRKLRWKHI